VDTKILEGIEMKTSPECYLTAIASVLNFNGYDGESLVNHQLGFAFRPPRKSDSDFNIRAFYNNDAYDSIYDSVGVRISSICAKDWEECIGHIWAMLRTGQPAIQFVDIFFIPYFPKDKGHAIHTLLVYGLDLSAGYIYVKSAMPGDWKIPLDNFRLACCSVSDRFTLKYRRLNFDYAVPNKPFELGEIFKRNIEMMERKDSTDGCHYGLSGLQEFLKFVKKWIEIKEMNQLLVINRAIFKQLISVVYQRKRYVAFLESEIPENAQLLKVYRYISVSWEIFRNMCFKLTRTIDENFLRRALIRLEKTIELEVEGLDLIRNLNNREKSILVLDASTNLIRVGECNGDR